MIRFLFIVCFCFFTYLNAEEKSSPLLGNPSCHFYESSFFHQEPLEAHHPFKKRCKRKKPTKNVLNEYIGAFTQNTVVFSDGTTNSLFPFDNIGVNSNIVFVDSIRSFLTSAAGDYEIFFNIMAGDIFNGTTPIARVLINDVPEVTALPSLPLSKAPPTGNITITGIVNLPANSTIALQYIDVNTGQIYAARQVSAVIKKVD